MYSPYRAARTGTMWYLHKNPFFFPLLWPTFQWRVNTRAKELYLTFDDGPVPGPTEFVLEQLKQYHAKATFFCVGHNIEKHPDIFARVVAEGHSVGNHTFNHLKGLKTDTQTYLSNTLLCDRVMAANLPADYYTTHTKLFRPPYGLITKAQSRPIGQSYRIVMWQVLSADFDPALSPETCLRKTEAATGPGSIVLFHDSLKAERNMSYALPRFLERFSREGYLFKAL